MTIVTSYDWESDTWTHNGESATRQAWREAVAEIADKAKAKLPECSGRVESAVKIVLAGDVALQADGTAKVASQSNGSTAYQVVNGHCDCKDFVKAPHNLCKHRLSAAIVRRAHGLAQQRLEQREDTQHDASQPPPEPSQGQPQGEAVSALPEAPASVNCHILMEGRQVHVTLRDTDETRLLTRLATLLRQYPLAQPPTQHTVPPMQTPVCQWHGAMKESTKAKGTWYCPAKMADGSYCKSRHPEKGK